VAVYEKLEEYVNKNGKGISFRLKQHAFIIEKHLNPGEEVIFAFPGQKNAEFYNFFTSCVVVLTNKRLLIGQKRVLWGYFLRSITPDLYNDLFVYRGLLWGKIVIDTVKEEVIITNLTKKGLTDIETNITEFMMREKQKYGSMNQDVV